MILSYKGMHYIVPDKVAETLAKYEKIVKVLEERSPYKGNHETCDIIRKIVNE